MKTLFALLPLLLCAGAQCRPSATSAPAFTESRKLGGTMITPDVLNEGRDAYIHYCRACHGDDGDGRGHSAPGMRPPPRDFRTGMFKFGGVPVGQLPHDEDIVRVVKQGLGGTPMLPWDLSDRERGAVVQYIKTFSKRFAEEDPGERILPTPDPWAGKESLAVEVGKRIYHLSGVENDAEGKPRYFLVGCSGCHPSYITRAERVSLSRKYLGAPPADMAELADMYRPSLKPSEYKVAAHELQILPVDFLFHNVKNGTTLPELYRTISAGIAGAAMPAWKGVLNEESLWALTHYVKSLIGLRGSTAAVALRESLMNQPPDDPPAPQLTPQPAPAPRGTPPAR